MWIVCYDTGKWNITLINVLACYKIWLDFLQLMPNAYKTLKADNSILDSMVKVGNILPIYGAFAGSRTLWRKPIGSYKTPWCLCGDLRLNGKNTDHPTRLYGAFAGIQFLGSLLGHFEERCKLHNCRVFTALTNHRQEHRTIHTSQPITNKNTELHTYTSWPITDKNTELSTHLNQSQMRIQNYTHILTNHQQEYRAIHMTQPITD